MKEKSENQKVVEVLSETKSAENNFFTVKKTEPKNQQVAIETQAESKPPKKPTNNILLGEIEQETLELIKEGKTLQAKFYSVGIWIKYIVQKGDSPEVALSALRDAIFAAQYGQKLPANTSIESNVAYLQGFVAPLGRAIAATGEIDALIQVF